MSSPALQWVPPGFHDWLPVSQAAALGLLTLVQEDIPAVSAALLTAAGSVSWQVGFFGVFLGIWLGDALLYLLARALGRPLLQRSWAKRFIDPAAVVRSEHWFARQGTWVLLSSRFVPGTRLPTYLAAGILRLPFGRFLLVTGTAVAIWTASIFWLAQTFGVGLMDGLMRWNSGGWTLLVGALISICAVRLACQCGQRNLGRRLSAALGRWRRWEFWPAWLFYFPIVANYLRLAFKFRSLTLPTAANPGIFSGGVVGESKIATLRDLHATSPEFTAEAHLLEGTTPGERLASFDEIRRRHRLDFPLILKPDVGQRGVGVRVIRTVDQSADYIHRTHAPLLIQQYVPGPREAGVFYYRFPDEPRGRIFAITEKIFPTIMGDGQHTIEELVWTDPRARLVAAKYLARLGPRRSEIPPLGQCVRLVETGNHAQGCIFRDGAPLWSEELERRIDDISRRLQGFFIGRYDLRYVADDDLRAGRRFKIIELNGAASEATSIYDSRNSLLAAYRTLFHQWELVFAIGAANKRRGCPSTAPLLLWRKWRETTALAATYPLAD